MKMNPARLFVLVSFCHESEFIDALRLLEKEIGTAYYFSVVFSSSGKSHKLLAYEKKIKLEQLALFFSRKKKFRQESAKLLSEIILGCCAADRVQTVHETDSPFRVFFTDKVYLQNQLFFRDIGYVPLIGHHPAFEVKPALVFFSDLRRLITD